MGLDVHLYKYDNQELYTKTQHEIDEKVEAMWEQEYKLHNVEKYEDLSKDLQNELHEKVNIFRNEQEEILKQVAGECEGVEINSAKYPDHMFKIGYLRSSYNDGGINSLLRKTIGKDLNYIFDPGKDYAFTPDWINCRYRATEVLKEFNDFIAIQGNFFVSSEPVNHGRKDWQPNSVVEALKIFNDEKKKNGGGNHPFGGSYTNGIGSFYLTEPMKVSAIMRGTVDKYGSGKFEDCFYLVYENEEGYAWYRKALEITTEMIDWVLSQTEPHKYALHWSS